jgi:hypothetical protein
MGHSQRVPITQEDTPNATPLLPGLSDVRPNFIEIFDTKSLISIHRAETTAIVRTANGDLK